MDIKNNLAKFKKEIEPYGAQLILVSKTQSADKIKEAYQVGQKKFGESKVQELNRKEISLPKDINWHYIGHLQRNKVSSIIPYISLIQTVDSVRLMEEIDKQAKKQNRIISCLLQIYIAKETTKFGIDYADLNMVIESISNLGLSNIKIQGLMGIASLTEDEDKIRSEFKFLRKTFDGLNQQQLPQNVEMKELSMGMSSDYKIALQEGSTLIRIGTAIFGSRNY